MGKLLLKQKLNNTPVYTRAVWKEYFIRVDESLRSSKRKRLTLPQKRSLAEQLKSPDSLLAGLFVAGVNVGVV